MLAAESYHVSEVYEIAKKVKVKHLYTDNNKSIFFSLLAGIHSDLGHHEEALNCIEQSQQLPHREFLNEHLQNLKTLIIEQREPSHTS